MSPIVIAPQLQRALEAMSRDMGVEPQALVNQAIFAWLRINGYVVPSSLSEGSLNRPSSSDSSAAQPRPHSSSASGLTPAPAPKLPVIPPPPAPAPAPAPVAAAPAPAPAEPAPAPVVAAPPPAEPAKVEPVKVEAPKAEPVKVEPPKAEPVKVEPPKAEPVKVEPPKAETPKVDPPKPEPVKAEPAKAEPAKVEAAPTPTKSPATPANVLARMNEIDGDLKKNAKPWPAWVDPEEKGEEEEEEKAPASKPKPAQAASPEKEAAAPAKASPSSSVADEGPPEDDLPTSPPVDPPTQAPSSPEPQTGEINMGQANDSTIVRTTPVNLFLERPGQPALRMVADRFVIGRGPKCDLIIDSPRVSREHAALLRVGGRYFIEDLGSSNGTWFGQDRITRREIESGDAFNLGNEPVTFTLRAD